MRKIITLALASVLVLSLAACGGGNNGGGSTATPPSNSSTTTPPSNTTTPPASQYGSETPSSSDSTNTPSKEPSETGLNESIKKWPDNEWTQQIPKPITGVLISAALLADNGGFTASIKEMADGDITYHVTEDDFTAYTESCISMGWSEIEETDTFNASKGDYRIAIDFYTGVDGVGGMNISITKA